MLAPGVLTFGVDRYMPGLFCLSFSLRTLKSESSKVQRTSHLVESDLVKWKEVLNRPQFTVLLSICLQVKGKVYETRYTNYSSDQSHCKLKEENHPCPPPDPSPDFVLQFAVMSASICLDSHNLYLNPPSPYVWELGALSFPNTPFFCLFAPFKLCFVKLSFLRCLFPELSQDALIMVLICSGSPFS